MIGSILSDRAAVLSEGKGAKPTELPVLSPAKFDLVINLKTAKAIGLPVSPIMIACAKDLIQ